MIFFLTAAFAQEPPPVGEGIVLRPPIPENHTLSDGTPVWLIEDHGVPLVRVEVSLRQGYLTSSDPVAALLVGVVYRDGRRGHLLALLDAARGAEAALARAMNEALVFSGIEAGELDVVFLPADAPAAVAMARVALRFDLPAAEVPAPAPEAPGMDPTRPPRLR